MPRHGHAIFNRHAINRNKRHHIRRPHPRMRPLMHIQINQFRGLAHPANRRFLNLLPLAHQCNHAPVMVRVHLAVQQVDAVHLHGVNNCINFGLVTAFREVRNAFDERRHK